MESINLCSHKSGDLKSHSIFFADSMEALKLQDLTNREYEFLQKKYELGDKHININRFDYDIWVCFTKTKTTDPFQIKEEMRRLGCVIAEEVSKKKIEELRIIDLQNNKHYISCFIEGLALKSYVFDKYKVALSKLNLIEIDSKTLNNQDLELLENTIKAVFKCRDLVNEPLSYLSTGRFKEEIKKMASESGLDIDFFDKAKISSLKMGGIIAVNKGSEEPPFMAIAKWQPANALNKKPYILVGKGITYDSGGYSIKPSEGMIAMKCDMGGATVTISTMSLLAMNKIPLYVIALIPATDNKINERAQVPGDIIYMHDGTTVEVLNTDAEGRLILADALSYAKKYQPQLVIDMATLTGSAHAAIGKYGILAAGKNHEKHMEVLKKSGFNTHERIVEFPMWEEYNELIESKNADIKNTGGKYAGAIAAAKFLEHFTDYPWIHLDMAGTAFYDKPWNYNPYGGTGIGVRLLYDFFMNQINEN